MKWCAIFSLILAAIVRFAWHSQIELAFPINATTHRGYPIRLIVFWLLLVTGVSLALIAFVRHSH